VANPAVEVEIAKSGTRPPGVPAIENRVQGVVVPTPTFPFDKIVIVEVAVSTPPFAP
jgi:hypothetical protein